MVPRAVCLVVLLAGAAGADTVRLVNGQELEGKAERLADGSVRLEFPGGGSVTLSSEQVAAVELGPTLRDIYAERRRSLAPGHAAGHYLLGKWCREKGLKEEAEQEFREVIRIDPDHAGGREALGYVRRGTEWTTVGEYRRERGEVFFEGRWMPEGRREGRAAVTAQMAAAKAKREKEAGPKEEEAAGRPGPSPEQ